MGWWGNSQWDFVLELGQTSCYLVPTSCKPRANLVQTLCKPRVDLVPTSCKPCANLVQTSCKPRANLMQTLCKPRANLVQTLCKPCADLVQTLGKPRANLMSCNMKYLIDYAIIFFRIQAIYNLKYKSYISFILKAKDIVLKFSWHQKFLFEIKNKNVFNFYTSKLNSAILDIFLTNEAL